MRRVRVFLSHWQNWVGLLIILCFAVVTLTAPLLSPPNDTTQGAFKKVGRAVDLRPHPPSAESILGTLPGQIDVYHALIWGSREAMIFGLSVALGAFLFGSLFGAIAGYAGGMINNVLMRIADAFLTFPMLAGVVFLQQLVVMTVEAQGGIYWVNRDFFGQLVYYDFTPPPFAVFLMKVDPILICLIIFSWMPFARVVNTMVITLKNTDFIQAARALGGSPLWVIRKHLLPNAISPAIVLAARDVGSSVIMQATITFIGLGGTSAWGILLSLGRNWVIGPGGNMLNTWWVFLPATLAIVLFGVGWNLMGDGLAEALDPTATIFRRTQPDDAVTLVQPEKTGKPVKTSPDWRKSPGIGSGAAAATVAAAQPDMLKTILASPRVTAFPKEMSKEVEQPSKTTRLEAPIPGIPKPIVGGRGPAQPEGVAIPDWMREASWGESTGAFEETAEGELVKPDLPDWIKALAPKETELSSAPAGTSSTSESSPIDDETLEWLKKLGSDKPFGSMPASGTPHERTFEETLKAAQPNEVPNWLSNLETPSLDSSSPAAGEVPDWLSKMEEPSHETAASVAASVADWLSKLDNEEAPISEHKKEIPPVAESVIPVLPAADTGSGNLDTSTADQEPILLWLENLAAKQGAKSEDLISKPEGRIEKPPKWVEQVREVPESQPVSQIPEQAAPATPTAPADAVSEEDIPLWMRGADGKLVSPASVSLGDIPDWMRGDEREEPAAPAPVSPADWVPEAEVKATLTPPEPSKPEVRKPEPKIQPKFELKFEMKPELMVEPKSEAKPQPKPQLTTKPVPQAKPESKPAAAAEEDKTRRRRDGVSPPLIESNLALARDAMSRGRIPDALQVYGNLIRKGKVLEDITLDLEKALYRFPVEISIWQTLGDAYMRSNRLQDALDAYTKAEDLLR